MKESRFNEIQIIGLLYEPEAGSPAAEVFRRNGISEQTFYRGKAIGERKQRIGRTQAEVAEG